MKIILLCALVLLEREKRHGILNSNNNFMNCSTDFHYMYCFTKNPLNLNCMSNYLGYHSVTGLKLIDEDDSEKEDDIRWLRRSPVIPIISPIPIRLRTGMTLVKDSNEVVSLIYVK